MTIRSILMAGIALSTLGGTAFAQASDQVASVETARETETVLVTARKKSEDLQEVPLSVTAFSSAAIKEARIEKLADVAKLTPGLNYTPLFGAQNQLPIIRGAAQTFGALNVGVFLDGIYLSGKAAVDLELNDLERIEVVKGPQSALYGRNTFSGAINYVTKAPSDVLTGDIEVSGGTDGYKKAIASLSGPLLGDTLRFRAGVYGKDFDGFYTSAIDGGKVDYAENYGGILTLEWTPIEQLTATLRLSGSQEESGQPASNVQRTNAFPGRPAGSPVGTVRNILYVGEVQPVSKDGVFVNTRRVSNEVLDYGSEQTIGRGSFELEYEDPNFVVTSQTSYSNRTFRYSFDGDNTICDRVGGCPNFGFPFVPAIAFGTTAFGTSSADGSSQDLSQEIRIASPAGRKLEWLFGAFYYKNKSNTVDLSLNPLTIANRTTAPFTRAILETESYAFFGSLTYPFTEKLTVTGELRYETEDQTYVSRPTNSRASAAAQAGATFNLQKDFDFVTPRVIVDYQATENTMLFATIGKGFKTGGFNTNSAITPAQRTYEPEESWNYEIGTKSTLMGGDLVFNTALYYTDWQDQQVACQNPITTGTSTQRTYVCNVGQASVIGIELDGVLRISDRISVSANYAYTNAEYSKFVDDSLAANLIVAGLPPLNFDGKKLPYVPEHKFVISPRYTQPAFGDFMFNIRMDLQSQSEAFVRADNLQSFGSKTTVDLRAGLTSPNWTFSAFVNNLLDDDTPTAAVRFFDSVNFSLPAPYVTGADRRLIGATIGYTF